MKNEPNLFPVSVPVSAKEITGLILAGGQARRMGVGKDKAFISLAGRTLLEHVLARFSPQVEQVVISANGDPSRFSACGLPVIADVRQGFHGPLAGIEAAFAATEAAWILSVAVDLPFLPRNLVEKMLQSSLQPPLGLPVIAQSANRCHYVVSLWPRSAMDTLQPALENGQLSLYGWFDNNPHKQVAFSPVGDGPDPFFNINRPEDLRVAANVLMNEKVTAKP